MVAFGRLSFKFQEPRQGLTSVILDKLYMVCAYI